MPITLNLPAEITIYTVAELRSQWLDFMSPLDNADQAGHVGDSWVSVDAASVAEIDAAGMQLLMSLHNSLLRRDRTLYITHASPPLRAACSALGASALLDATRVVESAS